MKNQHDGENSLGEILAALQTLSHADNSAPLPPEALWPKTRHIANYCNLSIYATRRYLMILVKMNKAHVSSGPIDNSLRWYIVR